MLAPPHHGAARRAARAWRASETAVAERDPDPAPAAAEAGAHLDHDPFLSLVDLFQDLAPREILVIERNMEVREYRRGQVLFSPGETGEVVFAIKSGRVNLSRTMPDGRKIVVATLEAGTVLGATAVVGKGVYGTVAETLEPCVLYLLARRDLERMLVRYPPVAMRMLEYYARLLRDTQARLADMAFKGVSARIAGMLLRFGAEEGQPMRFSHQDIADMVGASRESVSRSLEEMRAVGLIDFGRMSIVVTDRAALDTASEEPA